MSAFFVSNKTITSILLNLDVPMEQKTEIGKNYLKLNYEALNSRYNLLEEEKALYISDIKDYVYNEHDLENNDKTLLQSFLSLRCLMYQCCEGNVPESELFKNLEKLSKEFEKKIKKMFPNLFESKKESVLDLCCSMQLKWDI